MIIGKFEIVIRMLLLCYTEASLQGCFYKKVFWKYAANLQESTYAEV